MNISRTIRSLRRLLGFWLAAWPMLAGHVQSQTVDPFNPNPSNYVQTFALQPDWKVVLGGGFAAVNGQTRSYLARLNNDGSLDTPFSHGAGPVYSLLIQPDGKILVASDSLQRFNPDGTLDTAFNPGLDNSVLALALQADGKILIGGAFRTVGGRDRASLARLNPDGSLDTAFNPGTDYYVNSLAVQPDGKIVVGGYFVVLAGQPRNNLGRLNANGTCDTTFTTGTGGTSPQVFAVAVQADGKILVGGYFTTLGGWSRRAIGRLNANGTVDTGFNPVLSMRDADPWVGSFALQADGKTLIGGMFGSVSGSTRNGVARLLATGALDTTFDTGVSYGASVTALGSQTDGKILLGGYFTDVGGQPRNYVARLINTGPATQSLSVDGSTLTWLRAGASPEVWRTTFEYSTNQTDWVLLGSGARVTGGWRLAGVQLPADAMVRARGFVGGGGYNASGWFVESVTGPPVIIVHPTSRTNAFGTTASFSVAVTGSEPLGYQWLKDGRPLLDGGNASGTATPALTLAQVLNADQAGYSVVISNQYGSVTSAVARLAVSLSPTLWSRRCSPTTERLCSVVYGASNYVAVGFNGTVLSSPDGVRWTPQNSGTSLGLYSVAYANGTFVAVGQIILSSANGADWTIRDQAAVYDYETVAFVNGEFIAVGANGSMKVSTNGTNWSDRSSGTTATLYGVAYGQGVYVVVGAGGTIRTSVDGLAWSSRTSGTTRDLNGVTYGGGLFVAQGNNGALVTSPNGTNWTARGSGTASALCTSAYGFDQFGADGMSGTIIGSPNGTSWARQTSGVTNLLLGLCAGPNTFVAVGDAGAIVQSVIFPANGLWQQPTNQIVRPGHTAQFRVTTWWSTPTPSYQWKKDGLPLMDGDSIAGATTSLLTIDNVGLADLGGYSVIINSGTRWVTSRVASLVVAAAPSIVVHPVSQEVSRGQDVLLSVTAAGVPPLSYQWRTNAVNLDDGDYALGAHTPTLSLTNVQSCHSADYCVLVSNPYGSVTSAVATLTVIATLDTPSLLVHDGNFGFRNNQFGFNVAGSAGQTVVIEASPDLQHWTALATNLLGTTPWYYGHPGWTNFSVLFYRARLAY